MQTQHIALVPEVAGINASDLARVSAAIQKQILRDVAPIWQIKATVDPFPHLEDVPVGYWPVILAFGELGSDEGVHCDRKGQPYALIEMSPSWSLTASHVCIEMLIDPYGNRTLVGPSPRSDQGSVEFQIDICDPCEDARYGYTVNDVLVSDFCTPEFLAQIPSGKERYSFTGAVEAPYQVLPGGRLTWYDPQANRWWQRNHFGGAVRDTDLGPVERRAGRGFSVNHPRAPKHLQATKMTLEAFESRMGIQRQRALHASQSQAHLLRVHLGNPGGVGDLTLDAAAPTGGALGAPRAAVSDRPQVLAALIKASVNAADPSVRRRSLAEALATNEERAVVGASAAPLPAPDATLPSARYSDPTGFDAVEDTVAIREAKVQRAAPPPSNPLPPPTPPPMASRPQDPPRAHGSPDRGEMFAPRHSRAQMDRRQTVRTQQAWDPPRARTTIPPPGPRPTGPSLDRSNTVRSTGTPERAVGSAGRTTGRAVPSVAPTSMNVASVPPVRPQSSLRDKLLLAGGVGAAGLVAIALFGSSGAPTQAPAAAASIAPNSAISAAAVAPSPGSAAPANSAAPTESAAAKPLENAAVSAAAPPAPHPPAARAAAPKGPRPKTASGNVKASDNPYDSPPESMEKLVEERR
jgi:hypothetical protein